MSSRSLREEARRILGTDPGRPWLTLLDSAGAPTVVTREQLARRIHEYGAYYLRAGVREGDTVLIILKESVDLVAAFVSAICVGAVPAYYAYPSPKQSVEAFGESLRHLLSYNAVRLLVSFDEVLSLVGEDRTLATHGWRPVAADRVSCPAAPAVWDGPAPAAEAFLQFSSGTTGAKKGVRISTEALFNQTDAYAPFVGFTSESTVVSWLPHYHDMGLIACLLMPFLAEVPVVMMSPFAWVRNPAMLLTAITAHRGTHVWLPNFALGHLTRGVDCDLGRYDLGSIRKLVLCSEPVLADTVQPFLEKFGRCGLSADRLENCYAMAENTFAMTSTNGGGLRSLEVDSEAFSRAHRAVPLPGGRKLLSAGRPLPNVSLRLIDEAGRPVADGTVGEVWIQSNCMLAGYHQNPAATAEAMADGWFKTGDLGFRHDGDLFITGRKKDVIIVAGENIYPQDVEALLNADPALLPGRNVVFGVDDGRVGTERLVILAEVAESSPPPDELHVRTRIGNALNVAVGEVCFLPHMTLRKGTAGKISRILNKQAYLDGLFRLRTFDGPSSRDEALRRAVQAVLLPSRALDLGDETPLLSSGLVDSLAFVDLVRRVEEACVVAIPAAWRTVEHFETLGRIRQTVAAVRHEDPLTTPPFGRDVTADRQRSLEQLKRPPATVDARAPFVERCINHSPFRGSAWYRWLFRRAGIRVGTGVTFLGRVTVKLRGRPENIVIGDRVILGDGVDLRNRENGRVVLHERVYLDRNVRVTAARDGAVEIGFGSEVGAGSIINSGGQTRIGEFCLIAGGVNINASRHGTAREAYVKAQAHTHGVVEIGNDVWIGSGASIVVDTRIGEGAIIGSNSLVHGEVPAFAICAGVPAEVIRYR
jgi:acyl-CoA synthetase (AMP-forming)/AMP-acid ligase II/acetyltransferase-like isoleucine patch superfamily enzyme